MRLLLLICFFALLALGDDDPLRDWKRHLGVEEEFTNSKCVFVGTVASSKQIIDRDGFIQGTFYVVRRVPRRGRIAGRDLEEAGCAARRAAHA